MYHFFPGGKQQFGAEVVRYAAGRYAALFPSIKPRKLRRPIRK